MSSEVRIGPFGFEYDGTDMFVVRYHDAVAMEGETAANVEGVPTKEWEQFSSMLLHRAMGNTGEEVARANAQYEHDCEACHFIGILHGYDVYVCPQSGFPTIVARHGDDGPEYVSGQTITLGHVTPWELELRLPGLEQQHPVRLGT